MYRRIIRECLVIVIGTLVFLLLCASVGISRSEHNDAPIVVADERVEGYQGEESVN